MYPPFNSLTDLTKSLYKDHREKELARIEAEREAQRAVDNPFMGNSSALHVEPQQRMEGAMRTPSSLQALPQVDFLGQLQQEIGQPEIPDLTEESEYLTPPPTIKNEGQADYLNGLANVDIDLNTALFTAGQSFGFDASKYDVSTRQQARTGNVIRGVGAVGKSLLNMGRLVGAGMGYQNRMQDFQEDFNRKKYEYTKGPVRTLESGGTIQNRGYLQFFREGGTVDKLPVSKAMTGEFATGVPLQARDNTNAEVEKGEYLQTPQGDVQQVVGQKHNKGGERMNLEPGTNVISDKQKLGAKYAKELRKQYGINVKAKDTYAKAIEKYTKKIGLTKLNTEQEEVFKRLEKEESTLDKSTKNLNHQFLSEKINEIEQKKATLEEQRKVFTDQVFEHQESSKAENTQQPQRFENGGRLGESNPPTLKEIQTKLKALGLYKGDIDGISGPATLKAIKGFQQSKQLDVDGIAGKVTLAALFDDSYKTPRTGEVERDTMRQYGEQLQKSVPIGEQNYTTNKVFHVNSSGKTDKEGCTEYVNCEIRDSVGQEAADRSGVYGDAWTIYDNIANNGGTEKYNIFPDSKPENIDDPKAFIKGLLDNSEPPSITAFEPGDVVNLYYGPSENFEKAYKEGGRTFSTHSGVVKEDKNGSLFIEHNIRGKLHKERIEPALFKNKNLRVTAISHPDYEGNSTLNNIKHTAKGMVKDAISKFQDGGVVGEDNTYKSRVSAMYLVDLYKNENIRPLLEKYFIFERDPDAPSDMRIEYRQGGKEFLDNLFENRASLTSRGPQEIPQEELINVVNSFKPAMDTIPGPVGRDLSSEYNPFSDTRGYIEGQRRLPDQVFQRQETGKVEKNSPTTFEKDGQIPSNNASTVFGISGSTKDKSINLALTELYRNNPGAVKELFDVTQKERIGGHKYNEYRLKPGKESVWNGISSQLGSTQKYSDIASSLSGSLNKHYQEVNSNIQDFLDTRPYLNGQGSEIRPDFLESRSYIPEAPGPPAPPDFMPDRASDSGYGKFNPEDRTVMNSGYKQHIPLREPNGQSGSAPRTNGSGTGAGKSSSGVSGGADGTTTAQSPQLFTEEQVQARIDEAIAQATTAPTDAPETGTPENPSGTTPPDNSQTGINGIPSSANKGQFGNYYLPDQSVVPPEGIAPHLATQRRYEGISPTEITNEEQIRQINRNQDFASQQINSLPDGQRRAALANLAATSQQSINNSEAQVAQYNAQNRQRIDQINAGTYNREVDAGAQDAMSYEGRQLTAQAKTQADLFNYFDYNKKVRLGNFNTRQRMNFINDLYENYKISQDGGVAYNPNEINFILNRMNAINGQ